MPANSLLSRVPAAPLVPPLIERTLGPGWRCVPDAVIRAHGEAGPVDLVALHPRAGVVLAAFVAAGEEASPDEAVAAFRAMLAELDFVRRFRGRVKVAALVVEPARRHRLAAAIREAAGALPDAPPEPGWVEWLAQELAPGRAADAPRLGAPDEPILPPLAPPPKRRSPRLRSLWRAAAVLAALTFVLLALELWRRGAAIS